MQKLISNKTFDAERSLYGIRDTEVRDCVFAGPADGESALKECRDVKVSNCSFSLRYPLWHAKGYNLINSSMDEKTRAAIWYARDGVIDHSILNGIKCLRECDNTRISHSTVASPEFGWRCRGVELEDTQLESEYFLFESSDIKAHELRMKGKYSFQYTKNVTISNSELDTKDAFWHSDNVTVTDSVVKGEYLGWFSNGLTLINCDITGTQPLCYCTNLKLVNCRMNGTDLAFEYSDVDADVQGDIMSVKNPRSGRIVADSVGEIIREDAVMDCTGEVIIRGK